MLFVLLGSFVLSMCLFLMGMGVFFGSLLVMVSFLMFLMLVGFLMIFISGFMFMRTMTFLMLFLPDMGIFLVAFLVMSMLMLMMTMFPFIFMYMPMFLMRCYWWHLRVRFTNTDLLSIHLRHKALSCELSDSRIFLSLVGRLILLIPFLMATVLQFIF